VVKTRGTLLSPARVEFEYEISRPSDATINAVGRTVHAAVDATGRPCRLPDYIRELLN
jgi:acyl-CoA thioesterase FadM